MTARNAVRYRKVSLDASLCGIVEDMIAEHPEVARNLSRFVDDAVRNKLQDVRRTTPSV